MMAAHRPSSLVQVEAEAEAVLRLVSRPQLSRGRPMPGRRKIEQQPPRSDFFPGLFPFKKIIQFKSSRSKSQDFVQRLKVHWLTSFKVQFKNSVQFKI